MMTLHPADSSRAQMKIQQMAFMLVAIFIFFSLVGLIYFSISIADLQNDVERLRDEEARQLVRRLVGAPEFAFTASSDCSACLDTDKAIHINGVSNYEKFWNLNFLMIERLNSTITYPNVACTTGNYPNCNKIVIIPKSGLIATKTAFVALARYDKDRGYIYELGRIHASANIPENAR